MPKVKAFSAGSVLYFTGDQSTEIYILRNGNIELTYLSCDTGEELRDKLKPGEFFGLQSVLGNYCREETAAAVVDSTVLVFNDQEFEDMAKKRPEIIFKTLKSFSNQLRRLGKQENLLITQFAGATRQPSVELFKNGDLHLKLRKFDEATYIYTQYITNYPNGVLVEQALERIAYAQKGVSQGFPTIQFSIISEAPNATEGDPDPYLERIQQAGDQVEISANTEELDKLYIQAKDLIDQKKYAEGLKIIEKIKSHAIFNENEESQEKTLLLEGRALHLSNKHEQSITHFTEFIQNFPSSPTIRDALYYIGVSYAAMAENEKAVGFLEKVINMDDEDNLAMKAERILRDIR